MASTQTFADRCEGGEGQRIQKRQRERGGSDEGGRKGGRRLKPALPIAKAARVLALEKLVHLRSRAGEGGGEVGQGRRREKGPRCVCGAPHSCGCSCVTFVAVRQRHNRVSLQSGALSLPLVFK